MADAATEQTPEQALQAKLTERLQAQFVSAADLSDGCGSKFQCVIISTLFEGKPLLVRSVHVIAFSCPQFLVICLPQERHRLVNEALKEEMKVRVPQTHLEHGIPCCAST